MTVLKRFFPGLVCAAGAMMLFSGGAVVAQTQENVRPEAYGEVLPQQVCFEVVNRAPYLVFGTIFTEMFMRPDGIEARHRSVFRLKENESEPFCTTGPFFEGRRIGVQLRTLVPVFECKTRIDQGPIVIEGRVKADGSTESRVVCY